MDIPGPSTKRQESICALCNINLSKYTCPKCSVAYCSIACYKSTAHQDCSEDFYKEWVETEMKMRSNDPDDRKKMIEILKRFHAGAESDSYLFDDEDDADECASQLSAEALDSDDDDQATDLADRMENIDINNADDVWAALTEAERQEFEAMIRNGEEKKILPQWTPWWSQASEKKLVEIIDEDLVAEFKKNCPEIVEVPMIPALEKASPIICYNLLNILSAYVCMALHFNGEHQYSPYESINLFLQLNSVVGDNKNFDDISSSVSSVLNKAVDIDILDDNNDFNEITAAVKLITKGPDTEHQNYFMLAALSDLYNLFNEIKNEFINKKKQEEKKVKIFPKKLNNNIQCKIDKLTKRDLTLFSKKLEYYLAWINKYSSRMIELNID